MRQKWEADELVELWTLSNGDWRLVEHQTGGARLGYAVLLKFHAITGRFPARSGEVPESAVRYLATQVQVCAEEFDRYPIADPTTDEHRSQILAAVAPSSSTPTSRPSSLSDHDTAFCQRTVARLGGTDERLEALATDPDALTKLQTVVEQADFETLFEDIDQLALVQAFGLQPGFLAELQPVPGQTSLDAVFGHLDHLHALRQALGRLDLFDDASEALVDRWQSWATRCSVPALRAQPREIRLTLLAALCWTRQREMTEALVELLIGLIGRLTARVEHRLHQQLTAAPRHADDKGEILSRLAEAALRSPDESVRTVLHPVVDEESLRELVREHRTTERDLERRQRRSVLRSTYSPHYQQIVTLIVSALEFRCPTVACWPIMAALGELVSDRTMSWSRERFHEPDQNVPVEGVVPGAWRDAVVDGRGRVERVAYELCVLVSLRKALSRRHILVAGTRDHAPEFPTSGDHSQIELEHISWPSAEWSS